MGTTGESTSSMLNSGLGGVRAGALTLTKSLVAGCRVESGIVLTLGSGLNGRGPDDSICGCGASSIGS